MDITLGEDSMTADAKMPQDTHGHADRAIVDAADEHDARIVVLGSSGRTDLPHIPLGSVSHRLLQYFTSSRHAGPADAAGHAPTRQPEHTAGRRG